MGSRSLQHVVTQNSIAFNAFIYGYAGHSLVTPHAPLCQIWWTQERIDAKVTEEYVASRLRYESKQKLVRPLAFDGLTDDTYLDWILEKAKRFFLILCELGVADQIFRIIDDSWDDDELPISLDAVDRLGLDESLGRKFYATQFTFLLRELHQGGHVDYGENEAIPLEYVHAFPAAANLQHWSRVHLPGATKKFVRRRIPLGAEGSSEADFRRDVRLAQALPHDHIAPVWASYTSKGVGFVLSSFVGHHTLSTFISHRTAPQYMRLSKKERQKLVLDWMHCLIDAVATLHASNLMHGAIQPSNILIDHDNNIAFADIGTLQSFQRDKRNSSEEMYNYAAPEAHEYALSRLLSLVASPRESRRSSMDSSISSHTSDSGRSRTRMKLGPRSSSFSGRTPLKTKPPDDDVVAWSSSEADIFSLGCVFLDMLTFMLRKKPGDFVKHRTTKLKNTAGNKSSTRTDASFHSNLAKLDAWMELLERLALEQDDRHFRAVGPLLQLIRDMVHREPSARPNAYAVAGRLRDILFDSAALVSLHCEVRPRELRLEHPGQPWTAPLKTTTPRSSLAPPMPLPPDLKPIPEDEAAEEERARGGLVADDPLLLQSGGGVPELSSATLRHSMADSMMSEATFVGSMSPPRPKSVRSLKSVLGHSFATSPGSGRWSSLKAAGRFVRDVT
ncbi:kinase-like domain-containing protein [Phyllosticta paracitricarpa]|uniref:Kinase-like domain-containing protein n=1 Tax=Phyllosticta citricarpa TaxID=55181 RepID=A0ABR1M7G3_9PEZI